MIMTPERTGPKLKQVILTLLFVTSLAGVLLLQAYGPLRASAGGPSDNRETWRVWAGIEIFPSYIAADQSLKGKVGDDGKIHLLIIYRRDKNRALEMADTLNRLEKIKNYPVSAEVLMEKDFTENVYNHVAGAYISERISDLPAFLVKASKSRILLFSPFEEDVEKGVPAGLYITDRITPYLNLTAMKRFNIDLKSFFVRISEIYD